MASALSYHWLFFVLNTRPLSKHPGPTVQIITEGLLHDVGLVSVASTDQSRLQVYIRTSTTLYCVSLNIHFEHKFRVLKIKVNESWKFPHSSWGLLNWLNQCFKIKPNVLNSLIALGCLTVDAGLGLFSDIPRLQGRRWVGPDRAGSRKAVVRVSKAVARRLELPSSQFLS